MDYNRVSLEDVCDLVAGYAFKSKDFGNYSSKVIKIAHITPPTVDMEGLSGVDITKYNPQKLEKYIAGSGDFVLAMTGATIGKIGRIEQGNAYINQRVLLFKNRNSIDKDYLYYVLQQYEFEQYILSHIDSESAQPNISAGTIGKYTFNLPDMEIQRKIGRLLRSLDAKREINRKINDNLLEQASALFEKAIRQSNSLSKVELSSLAEVKGGKRLPKGVNLVTVPNQHPYIRVRDLNNAVYASLSKDYEYVDN